MKRLAIIPARSGSKRIPLKNIKDFCGKPIISYPITEAKKSNLFHTIHVSTDDQLISEICSQYDCKPEFLRPKYLADDATPIMPVLKFVTEEYLKADQKFDQVWLLMACSPLIEAEDLIKASKVFDDNPLRPLLAVAEYPAPIEWAFTINPKNQLFPKYPGQFAIPSQKLDKTYFDAGVFAAFTLKEVINSSGAGSDQNFSGYILEKLKAIDIDTMEDWKLAENIYKNRIKM